MKKIYSTLMLLFFLIVPLHGMEQNPIEKEYKELSALEMSALRKELKEKDDKALLELLSYRSKDIDLNNILKTTNASSWELLSRFFAEDNLREFFEDKKALPQLTQLQEKTLKLQFLKFVGLYIAHPAPNKQQEKALLAIQELPGASIAQFIFVSDPKFIGKEKEFFNTQKLLILKTDYKTLALFEPSKNPPQVLDAQELPSQDTILLHIQREPAEGAQGIRKWLPSFVIKEKEKPYLKIPLTIANNKIAISKEFAPVEDNGYSLQFDLLKTFHDINLNPNLLNEISLNNLLFLAYLYHFQVHEIIKENDPLDDRYAEYYNALPEKTRRLLNLKIAKQQKKLGEKKVEKKKVSFADKPEIITSKIEPAKVDPNLIKKAAQQVWWKHYPAKVWNMIKTPFVSLWTKVSSWWK